MPRKDLKLMSELSKRFQNIMSDIEENITDPKDIGYISQKMSELILLHTEVIESITSMIADRLEEIEKGQILLNERLNQMQKFLSNMEDDMYSEDMDFEIVCPYCNAKFVEDVETKTDIKCPECNNIIELEWEGNEQEEYEPEMPQCNLDCCDKCFSKNANKTNKDGKNIENNDNDN